MKKTLSLILALLMVCSIFAFSASAEDVPVVTIGIALNTNVEDYYTNAFTLFLEEQKNVKIEYVLFTDIDEKLPVMVSSGSELPDIIVHNLATSTVWKWAQEGIFVPLNDYWEDPEKTTHFDGFLDFTGETDPEGVKAKILSAVTLPDGNIYTLPHYDENFWNLAWYRMRLNTAWLEKSGLDFPETLDDFCEILRYFRDNDMNGNGDDSDEVPFTSYGDEVYVWLLNSFLPFNASYNYLNVENGVVVPAYTQDAYREGLEYLHGMFEEGLIDPLAFTQDQAQMKALINNADYEMVGAVASGTRSIFSMDYRDDYDGNSIIAPVYGPEGVRYISVAAPSTYGSAYITKYAEDVDLCWDIMENFYDFEWYLRVREGVEDVNFTRDPDVVATYQGLFEATTGIRPIYVRTDNVWGKEQNVNWGTSVFPGIYNQYMVMGSYGQDLMPESGIPKMGNDERHLATYKPCAPEELLGELFYLDDELETLGSLQATIKNYVTEMLTSYIVGKESFDTWDEYLNELNNMGLEEYLEIVQTAYDRQH